MESFIVVRANDRAVKVTARSEGTINEKTLRRAFQLEDDVPIGLFKNELALACRDDDVFELQDGWKETEFELRWEESRRSRPATPMSGIRKRTQKIINQWEDRVFMVSGDGLQGTGILISHQQILTAAHLRFKIDKNYTIRGTNDQSFCAKCEFISKKYDFAVLKSTDLPECGTPIDQLQRGNKYVTMGYPNGIVSSKPSVSKGVMEGMMDDQIHLIGFPGSRRGYSGAPIINSSGCLTGILLGGAPGVHIDTTTRECLESSAEQKYARILGISVVHSIHNQGCSDKES